MKKVAMITYHASHNNGSFLQAYALQTYISSLEGYSCEIIDFRSPAQKRLYSVFKKINKPSNCIKNMLILMHYKDIKSRHDLFESFIDRYLKLSDRCYSSVEELAGLEEQYDVFLSGSDQIWNAVVDDFSEAYLLSFVSNKPKISYATSMGGKLFFADDVATCEKIAKQLHSYSAISVREQVAKQLLNQLIDCPIEVSLDPTFLLKPEEYEKFCADRLVEGDYIFFYCIEYAAEAFEAVKKFSKITGLPVIVVYSGMWSIEKVHKYGFTMRYDAGPDSFLSLIKYAKYVLSCSFHGIVFSIIMKKQFYTIRVMDGDEYKQNDRLDTLLNKLGLEDRQLDIHLISQQLQLREIDYSLVSPKLEAERQRSMAYLNRALAIESTEKKHDL